MLQEAIDVAVILNALRALEPGGLRSGRTMTAEAGRELHHNHLALLGDLRPAAVDRSMLSTMPFPSAPPR